jgi:hypothetical protein
MTILPRDIEVAVFGDENLGDLKLLPGVWSNNGELGGRGWNMIALPFISPDFKFNYRLLVNQYNETLSFTIADRFVKNRGISTVDPATNTDQAISALDYEQLINQTAAADFPVSGLAGKAGLGIHHEPGLWLVMSHVEDGRNDISRLASVPHGDSLLALGAGNTYGGAPRYPAQLSGLPSGASQQMVTDGYLQPYDYFEANPFKGDVVDPAFPGFNPKQPLELLKGAIPGTPKQTTELRVSTTVETGGILNIPFIVKQANAAQMKSTFWIIELNEPRPDGKPRLILQYLQVVMLDFFERHDGLPGLARWPHVSINTMEWDRAPDSRKLTESVNAI